MKPPLLRHKAYGEPSVFRPENLLREARRQNEVEEGDFEKGEADGVRDALALTAAVIRACDDRRKDPSAPE
jgi:alkylhydroperoxidase family enzyme